MRELSFRFEREDEWHGKLFALVEADGFAGEGGAWFNIDDLCRFGKEASAYPLRDRAFIAGGLGVNESGPEHVHLGISLEPHNARGAVRVTVQLATEVYNDEAEDLGCSATVRFLVTYSDLARFGAQFIDLIEDRAVKASLVSSAE